MRATDITPEEVDVMIDIETLDLKPTAKIVEIALCVVPTQIPENYQDLLWATKATSIPVTPVGQELLGLTESKSTLEWWQEDPVRLSHLKSCTEYGHPLADAMALFKQQLDAIGNIRRIWCKQASFDFAILRNAAYSLGWSETPWDRLKERDLRNEHDYVTDSWRRAEQEACIAQYSLTPHKAMDDAMLQAVMLTTIRSVRV